jgi:hypothetical protein
MHEHPEVRQFLAHEHAAGLAVATWKRRSRQGIDAPAVALRLNSVHDDPALERLAQLEGRPVPPGRLVVAEVDGVVVAAHPLAGGVPLADPFHPTAQILPLLRLRAEQVAPPAQRRRPSLRGHWSLIRGSIQA